MRKRTSIAVLLLLISIFTFTLIGCGNKDKEITITRFEIEDLELTETDTLDLSKATIICHLSDGNTEPVTDNLDYDKSAIKDKIDDENVLSNDSAGEYIIPVYHLDIHIGDLKVIVKVKR